MQSWNAGFMFKAVFLYIVSHFKPAFFILFQLCNCMCTMLGHRHLIQENKDTGTEFKHYIHKYVWSVICMNSYSIYLQIGSNSMCRLNIYFAYNRQWIIQMDCNRMEVYSVIHCFGPCSAWYVYYFTRPRYWSGCVRVSNTVSETVGSPWVSNHYMFSFFGVDDPFTLQHIELYWPERTLSFKLESVNVFYFIIHEGTVKSRKSQLSSL